ncbi:Long-chain-fatty-acid--CoA ligase 5 [Fasciola hepatica]|uniref:long-chain-fatty-acid--CoA ligase n=1 Tax=Fasciola hepatica TaxID=6192 RepID=A0A4E0R9D5_FASHE|nr:Long-chain-fatty-acid--CoA ligase 5 [Fasciola hepatica]
MDLQYPILAAATGLSLGALYLLTRNPKPRVFFYDKELTHQSSPANEKGDERHSEPQVTDDSLVRGLTNVCHLFLRGVKISGSKPCFGTRISQSEAYQWETYSEVEVKVASVASFLDELFGDTSKMVGIQSPNIPEWLIVQLACAARGHVVVPLYETFGTQACREIIEETQLELIFCGSLNTVQWLLQDPPACVKHLILLQCPDDSTKPSETEILGLRFHVLSEIIENNRGSKLRIEHRDTDQLFMICYTSGSSGRPKGVMIRHAQFIVTLKNLYHRLEDQECRDCPVHLCYLPLAHILEQLASTTTLLLGGRVGFLTGDITGFLSDMRDVQPNYLFTVPRVLSRLYTNVQQRVSSSRLMSKLLHFAIQSKLHDQERGYYDQTGIWDLLFFRRIRNLLGGHIRVILCGGAPISTDVLRFTRAAFSCPVLSAYGLTEACGTVCSGYFRDWTTGHVGAIMPEMTAKLVDVPEMGLLVANGGVGELVIKGPNCTYGYYNDPEQTRQLIDSDGWLHTGDLASWRPSGALEIVGRRKASFKLAQGEYVSPDKVEAMFQLCSLVDQVYVDGISVYTFAVAIVVPNFLKLRQFLTENVDRGKHMKACSDAELCSDPYVRELFLEELSKVGRANGLKGFELPKALYLTSESFTVDNELLTANLKLARAHLRRRFEHIIDQLYRERSNAE